MTVEELVQKLNSLTNDFGPNAINAEVKTSGDEDIEIILDLSYDTTENTVYINTVLDGED